MIYASSVAAQWIIAWLAIGIALSALTLLNTRYQEDGLWMRLGVTCIAAAGAVCATGILVLGYPRPVFMSEFLLYTGVLVFFLARLHQSRLRYCRRAVDRGDK